MAFVYLYLTVLKDTCINYFVYLIVTWFSGESEWRIMEIVLAVLFGYRLSPSSSDIADAEQGFKRSTDLCAYGWEDIALNLFPTASFLAAHDGSKEEEGKNSAFEMRIVEDIPEDEGSTGYSYVYMYYFL